jgi:hypothetical protein
MFLNTLLVEVVILESMKDLYAKDIDFGEAWKVCTTPWSIDRTP